jgi:hypothetical protein
MLFETECTQARKLDALFKDMDNARQAEAPNAFFTTLELGIATLATKLSLFLQGGFAEEVLESLIQVNQGFLRCAFADFVHIGKLGGFESIEFFMQITSRWHAISSSAGFLFASQPPIVGFPRASSVFEASRDLLISQVELNLVATRDLHEASSAFITCSTHC